MSRLIDADKLIDHFMQERPDYYHTSYIVGEIAAAPTVKTEGWISTKERKPDRNGIYLARLSDGVYRILEYRDGGWTEDLAEIENVTHWHLLPEPPKDEVTTNN